MSITTLEIPVYNSRHGNPVNETFLVDGDRVAELVEHKVAFMRMPNNSLLVSDWDDKYVGPSHPTLQTRSLSQLITGKKYARRTTKNQHDLTLAAYSFVKPKALTLADKVSWLTTKDNMSGVSVKRQATIAGIEAYAKICPDLSDVQVKMVNDIYSLAKSQDDAGKAIIAGVRARRQK